MCKYVTSTVSVLVETALTKIEGQFISPDSQNFHVAGMIAEDIVIFANINVCVADFAAHLLNLDGKRGRATLPMNILVSNVIQGVNMQSIVNNGAGLVLLSELDRGKFRLHTDQSLRGYAEHLASIKNVPC